MGWRLTFILSTNYRPRAGNCFGNGHPASTLLSGMKEWDLELAEREPVEE